MNARWCASIAFASALGDVFLGSLPQTKFGGVFGWNEIVDEKVKDSGKEPKLGSFLVRKTRAGCIEMTILDW